MSGSARAAIITVDGLSKAYQVTRRRKGPTSLKESFSAAGTSLWRRLTGTTEPGTEEAEFWALQDVGFQVARGEAVGIVGRNGAGKSTLLKILSRITEPTSGRAVLRGRVASLLEVGTGFHPDLTGRENVILNGAIMGMGRAEVRRQFDAIVAFAEVEDFIDTPVKRYSSGMYMRLAFAVAAHLDPEILVVDEVLAVGDAGFQRKCLGKMGDVSKEGRTILFVSHNMAAITSLCSRALLLEKGRLAFDGPAPDAVARYVGEGGTRAALLAPGALDDSGDDFARLLGAAVRRRDGTVSPTFDLGEPIVVEMSYQVLRPWGGGVTKPYPHIFVHADTGVAVLYSSAPDHSIPRPRPGQYIARAEIPAELLNAGTYSVDIALGTCDPGIRLHFSERGALLFTVTENLDQTLSSRRNGWAGPIRSAVWPALPWTVEPKAPS